VPEAIEQLARDIAEPDEHHLGLDIETSPRPGQGAPRPAIVLNTDGTLSRFVTTRAATPSSAAKALAGRSRRWAPK
jgi:hypothetical protein